MTAFTLGERATLMRWGRPLCQVTITRIDPNAVWATDDQGRACSYRPDGTSHRHNDHAGTRLTHRSDNGTA